MGGWLSLTQWGLAPHKRRQAFLGAHDFYVQYQNKLAALRSAAHHRL
jgi:hypothetical protein